MLLRKDGSGELMVLSSTFSFMAHEHVDSKFRFAIDKETLSI